MRLADQHVYPGLGLARGAKSHVNAASGEGEPGFIAVARAKLPNILAFQADFMNKHRERALEAVQILVKSLELGPRVAEVSLEHSGTFVLGATIEGRSSLRLLCARQRRSQTGRIGDEC